MSTTTKIALDYDDLTDCGTENCIDQLELMANEYPDIKINLFTIPAHNARAICDTEWVKRIRSLIDRNNISICLHGLWHSHLEFEDITKDMALFRLKKAVGVLNTHEIPYRKVFKGPNWGINPNTYWALNELGFTHVFNHEDHKMVEDMSPETENNGGKIRTVYYNWNLKDEPPNLPQLIVHGHTHDVCSNGIVQTYNRLKTWIQTQDKIEWLFADEL